MSLLRKLASDTALYGISSILARMLNYFLVFLHTSSLYGFAPRDFGILSELYIYVAFLMIIYTYGMETAFFRYASEGNMLKIYQQSLSILLITTVVFSSILMYFSTSIADLLGYSDKGNMIIWLLLILSIDTLTAIPFARLRLEKRAKTFALAKLANIGLNIFFNLFFLIFCKEVYQGNWLVFLRPFVQSFYIPELGIGYVFLANLLANATLFLLLYPLFLSFRFVWDTVLLRKMLWYAYPLIFMGLAGTINGMLDRIMLKYFLPEGFYSGKTSIEAVGIYAACYKLSIFMTLAIQAFKYAAEPFFFAQARDKNAPALFAKVMRYFVIACVGIWVVVSVNLDVFQYFYGRPAFREGIGVVPILLLANLFLGVYFNLSTWFKLTDRTYYGTWISVGGACMTCLLNWWLIPIFGYFGSAWVTLITYFMMALACYLLGQKYYPIPYPIFTILLHIGLASILILCSTWVSLPFGLASLSFHTFLWLGYVGFVVITERPQWISSHKKNV